MLLQYPLRGASRPYQSSGVEAVQYKPKNKKLQVGTGSFVRSTCLLLSTPVLCL